LCFFCVAFFSENLIHRKTHDEYVVTLLLHPGFFLPTCTPFWLISFGSQSDCAKPSNFRVAPNCLGVDFETFLKAKKENAEDAGPESWGFETSKNIEK